MDVLVEYWELIVMVIVALGGLFQAKSWWPYVKAGKEFGDVLVKTDMIDADGQRTDQEYLELGKEVMEAKDSLGAAFKKKVKA